MSAEIIIINDAAQPQIAAGCRALQYGDGVFTTIAVKQGLPELWPLHLARLQLAVSRLAITAPDWQAISDAIYQQAAAHTKPAVLKLLLSRGIGGRGYAPADCTSPLVYLYTAAMPDYRQWQEQGLSVGIAKLQLSIQPALAGLKHTNRLEQVLLKQELAQSGYDDLLVADQQQQLTEATAANIFYQLNNTWYTPPLHLAGVAGVMRQKILMSKPEIVERTLPLAELAQIQALFLTNALLGIAPVRQLAERSLSINAVTQLQQEILC